MVWVKLFWESEGLPYTNRNNRIYYNMQEEFDKALFEVAYSNLIDDFFEKNLQINKI